MLVFPSISFSRHNSRVLHLITWQSTKVDNAVVLSRSFHCMGSWRKTVKPQELLSAKIGWRIDVRAVMVDSSFTLVITVYFMSL